jgi:WD40 repeat protein
MFIVGMVLVSAMLQCVWTSCARTFSPGAECKPIQKLSVVLKMAVDGAEIGKVEMEPHDSVEKLRSELTKEHSKRLSEPAATLQLHLLHNQQLLHDSSTLSDCGLTDGAAVDIVRRWRHMKNFVVTGSADCTAKVWDIESGECFLTLSGHTGPVLAALPSPDNSLIATSSQDGTVKLWRVASGECIQTFVHGQAVQSLALSADGVLLASGTAHGVLRLWNVASGENVMTVQLHENAPVRSVDFSVDSAYVLTACGDSGTKQISLWSAVTGQCKLEFEEYDELVFSAKFSPDGRTVVAGCSDDAVQVWSVTSGLCIHEASEHDGAVHSATYSKNGQLILTGSSDATMKLWGSEPVDCIQTFRGHSSDVLSSAFSANDLFVGSASDDHTAKIWSTRSGECVFTLEGHCASVHCIEFAQF